MPSRRRFGRVRHLPSGRWQARYHGPDGIDRAAPHTFERRADADRWLAGIEDDLVRGDWTDPDAGRVPLRDYGTRWVVERAGLRPRTRRLYEGLFRLHISPTLGGYGLSDISPAAVRTWRSNLLAAGLGEVTVAKAYRLLKTILGTAVEDRMLRTNPCQIRGAAVERIAERPVLTVPEVLAVADALPKRFRLLVVLGTFCSLRWGELAALTRGTVDLDRAVVDVRVTLVELADGRLLTGPPKTAAGRRLVSIPPSLVPVVQAHLDSYVGQEPSALVFTGAKGGAVRRSNFQKHWTAALATAGLAEVHFHDLRHTGNTLTAHSGATLSDLMARMGHSSTRAARIYLHTSSDRDRTVAAALDALITKGATGT